MGSEMCIRDRYECENTSRPRILSLTSEITSSQNVVTALWSHLGRPISEAEVVNASVEREEPSSHMESREEVSISTRCRDKYMYL